MGEPIPLYASAVTLDEIRQRFAYAVAPPHPDGHFFRPTMLPNIFDGPFEAAGVKVIPFEQDHGFSRSWGFRIGDFAYSTDVVQLDERAFAVLEGVKVWIVDGLREAPHPTHSHIERTLEWIRRVRPERAILTHMDNNTDYAVTAARLPAGVEPGYDGLVVEL
jgi:phosphoribosyl 1,2-cyclic phosphate phosphodiesterase